MSRPSRQSLAAWRFVPYGYYDLGAVWDKKSTGGRARKSAASLGLGVRVEHQGSAPYLALANPLTRQVASQGEEAQTSACLHARRTLSDGAVCRWRLRGSAGLNMSNMNNVEARGFEPPIPASGTGAETLDTLFAHVRRRALLG
ncbi:MAG: hypothetical protein IV085_08060 [Thiobacillus sp.]|nr:hypothetical protein [Thiobacillus sp.]